MMSDNFEKPGNNDAIIVMKAGDGERLLDF